MDEAEIYVNANKLQQRDAQDIIEEFSNEISKMQGRCMDIGCGPGNITKELLSAALPSNAEIVGTDISEKMVEYAKRKYHNDKRLSFMIMDIEMSELPNNEIGQYDNVVSFYCLHWCANVWQALENIYKLLRADGKALIMFLGYHSGFEAYVRMNQYPRYQAYTQDALRFVPYFQRCKDSRATFRKILENIGFEILHCSKREKSFIYENQQTLRNHMLAVNPFISRIPEDMKKDFADLVLREIMSQKVLLPKKTENSEHEYIVLDRYQLLIAYVKKPL